MSETDQIQEAKEKKAAPETLELRARPQPVTRINRKVLIGGAAVFLMLLSGIVLVALKPPSLKLAERQELINVENKPITDGLNKLPATYEGVQPANPAPQTTPPAAPKLILPDTGLPLDDAESAEKTRLARMAGQARESQVFFRLQLKQPPQDSTSSGAQSEPTPRSSRTTADANVATLSLLRAT